MTGNRSRVVVYGAILLLLYPALVGVIQISNVITQPDSDEFPESCDDSPFKCSRLGPNPHRSTGETELRFTNTTILSISSAIQSWVSEEPYSREVNREEGVTVEVHIVVKTKWMRFADDVFIHVECDGPDAIVWIHSEARAGVSDIGVNGERITEIKSALIETSNADKSCSGLTDGLPSHSHES